MSRDNRQSARRVRLHAVTWSDVKQGAFVAIGLTCGVLTACTIAAAIVTILLEQRKAPGQTTGSLLLLIGMAPLSIVFSLPVLLTYASLTAWRTRRCSKGRWPRLCAMLKHPDAMNRYPHRVMEHAFYAAPHSTKRRTSLFRQFLPGHIIVRNASRPGDQYAPQPNDIPFEPIDLREDLDRTTEYFTACMQTRGVLVEFERRHAAATQSFGRRIRHAMAGTKRWMWKALWILLFGLMAYQTVRRGWTISTGYWVVILLAWLWRMSGHLLYERKWWIVPGGLVCRKFRMWRSRMQIYHFTPENTPLFLDCRTAKGYVVHDGKTMRFPLVYLNWWAVAAAWMSTATPPTMEQIESFIGNDNEKPRHE